MNYKANISKNMDSKPQNMLIVGVGEETTLIIKESEDYFESMINIIGLVDDNSTILESVINGYEVLGDIKSIPDIAKTHDVDVILVAKPEISHEERTRILDVAKATGARLTTMPIQHELSNQEGVLKDIRDVDIFDLMARKDVVLNMEKISAYIENKVVLVTGGGGSIGSELCRQISKLKPKQLIVLDIYENNAYAVQKELMKTYPELNLLVLIASVRDQAKVERIFRENKIETVFHSAAHKHVPLLETSPEEAIKNNVFGTWNVATAAKNNNAEKFIFISTDKACNPTSVMAASKRLSEMVVEMIGDENKHMDFMAIRFGNVIGSTGSVIPLFKDQIKKGGPVTLTHKDMARYFITIPEAVQLILEAGSYHAKGDVFTLDMGESVKIYDIATNLIKLSGLEPDKEIKIEISGLRPGELLHEEFTVEENGIESTSNKLIYLSKTNEFNHENFRYELEKIKEKLDHEEFEQAKLKEIIYAMITKHVTTV